MPYNAVERLFLKQINVSEILLTKNGKLINLLFFLG